MIDLRNVKQTAQVDAQTHERRGHELSICRDVVNHLYFGRHPFGGPTPFVFEVSSPVIRLDSQTYTIIYGQEAGICL